MPRSERIRGFPLLVIATLSLVACESRGAPSQRTAPPTAPAPTPMPMPAPAPPPAFLRLWSPDYNAGKLRAWDRASLAADRDDAPDVELLLPAGTRPNAVEFAANGDLWVTDNANDRLLAFDPQQLTAGGQPTPKVVIDSDGQSLRRPIGLVFDAAGSLWVAVEGRLEWFRPDNLDDSGPTTPNLVLTTADFDLPADLLFDGAGNLWVTNASFDAARNSVLAFTPDQLAAGGAVTPQLTLTSPGFALVEGLAFDSTGRLWIASNDGLTIAALAPADTVLPQAPQQRAIAPVASLEADIDDTASGRTIRKPGGLVLDADGDLWVNSQRGPVGGSDSAILRFAAAQLQFVGPMATPCAVLVRRATSNPGFGGLALQLR